MVRLHRRRSHRKPGEIESLLLRQIEIAGKPLSVYDLGDRLARIGEGVAAMQIYRTLGRLVERGTVHRIESLSAYVPRSGRVDCVSICVACHDVVLMSEPELPARLDEIASALGFAPAGHVIEVLGRCARCRTSGLAAPQEDSAS